MSVTETTINENDLILLESLLDGELSALEREALEQRLSRDATLARALDDLRAQRELRRSVFAMCEPSDASVRRVIATVDQKIENHMVWAERARSMRWLSGVAATLLIGFLGGYVFHSGAASTGPRGADNAGNMVASNNGVRATNAIAPNANPGALAPTPGAMRLVSNTPAPAPTPGGPRELTFPGAWVPPLMNGGNGAGAAGANHGAANPNVLAGYTVNLTDESGNVIGQQRFGTLQEAQEFRNDLSRLQQQRKQIQNGGVRWISDDF